MYADGEHFIVEGLTYKYDRRRKRFSFVYAKAGAPDVAPVIIHKTDDNQWKSDDIIRSTPEKVVQRVIGKEPLAETSSGELSLNATLFMQKVKSGTYLKKLYARRAIGVFSRHNPISTEDRVVIEKLLDDHFGASPTERQRVIRPKSGPHKDFLVDFRKQIALFKEIQAELVSLNLDKE